MFYNVIMDSLIKLSDFSQYMAFEDDDRTNHATFGGGSSAISPGEDTDLSEMKKKGDEFPIYMAALPGNKHVPLLKTVLTSYCEHNCYYCAFRNGRDFPRQSFNPEELANVFLKFYRAKAVEGLFLSSGVAGGNIKTQDRLLATA